MKKIIGLILGILIIAYSAFWYYGAKKAKELIETKIGIWQHTEKRFAGLKFDAIEMGGYPFSYEMTFKNLQANLIDGEGHTTYEVRFDEPYVVGTNILGTQFWKKATGNIHFFNPEKGNEGGKEDWIISGINILQANLDHSLSIDTFVHPFSHLPRNSAELEKFYENIASVSWIGKDVKIINAQYDSIPVYEMKEGRVTVGKKHQGEKSEEIHWHARLHHFSFLWNFRDYFPTADNSLDEIALMLALPNLGKKNLEIAGNIKGLNEKAFEGLEVVTLQNLPAFEVNGTQCDYSDDVSCFSSKGFFHMTPVVEGKRKGSFQLETSSLTTPAQFTQLQNQWAHFLDQTLLCKREGISTSAEEEGKACHSVKDLLPNLGELGKIHTNIRCEVALNDLVNPEKDMKWEIKKLDYTHDLYGVKTSGEILSKWPEVEGKYVLEILNYHTLIEESSAYLNRLFVALPEINPAASHWVPRTFPPGFTPRFIHYLESISDEPHTRMKDLKISIHWTNPLNIQVGTLNLSQFLEATENFEKSLKKEDTPVLLPKEASS